MIADYYLDGFKKKCNYGEEILVNPNSLLFIPVKGNLKATVEPEIGIKLLRYTIATNEGRNPPALFWSENLSSSGKEGKHVFETKYVRNFDDILPISNLDHVPERLRKEFLREVPLEVHQLANKIMGNERETVKILRKFYDFVCEHKKPLIPTHGKTIENLLDEYERTGYFYGNCKEARDFCMALCDSVGYPTKRVEGKSLEPMGHVWADVFVPVKDGYKLFPVDAALKHFGDHEATDQIFFEHTPGISWNFSKILNVIKRRKVPTSYKLKIELVK